MKYKKVLLLKKFKTQPTQSCKQNEQKASFSQKITEKQTDAQPVLNIYKLSQLKNSRCRQDRKSNNPQLNIFRKISISQCLPGTYLKTELGDSNYQKINFREKVCNFPLEKVPFYDTLSRENRQQGIFLEEEEENPQDKTDEQVYQSNISYQQRDKRKKGKKKNHLKTFHLGYDNLLKQPGNIKKNKLFSTDRQKTQVVTGARLCKTRAQSQEIGQKHNKQYNKTHNGKTEQTQSSTNKIRAQIQLSQVYGRYSEQIKERAKISMEFLQNSRNNAPNRKRYKTLPRISEESNLAKSIQNFKTKKQLLGIIQHEKSVVQKFGQFQTFEHLLRDNYQTEMAKNDFVISLKNLKGKTIQHREKDLKFHHPFLEKLKQRQDVSKYKNVFMKNFKLQGKPLKKNI